MLLVSLVSCSPEKAEAPPEHAKVFEVSEADLELQIKEGLSREQAKDLMEKRIKGVKAALKAGIDKDPVTRAEIARLLVNRHRETVLQPKIRKALANVTDDELRKLYDRDIAKFQQAERREVAVLWLDPGSDPVRKETYLKKLRKVRTWFLENDEIRAKPQSGFSVLSIDHSQHAASRYKGGVIGWLQKENSDPWSQAVSEIAFQTSDLSEVIDHAQGLFLVRVMKTEAARTQIFEAVRERLRNQESNRLRKVIEKEFEESF